MANPTSTSSASAGGSGNEPQSPAEVDLFVEDLLEQMKSRFDDMGGSILGRMDEMGKRMDDLERSIGDIMMNAGLEAPPVTGGVATTKAAGPPPTGTSGGAAEPPKNQRSSSNIVEI